MSGQVCQDQVQIKKQTTREIIMQSDTETIACPACGHEFGVTGALTGKMRAALKAELEEKAARKAAEDVAVKMRELNETLEEKDLEVRKFRDRELELLRKQRELKDQHEAMELEVARKLEDGREQMKAEVAARIDEEHRRKDLEKDKVINDLKNALSDMKRKAEQGSMETQGEVLEQELEERLKRCFPYDEFRPIKKGERGADLVQVVKNDLGRECGTILWEIKNAKSWSEGWIAKLKEDMQREKAAIGILSSVATCKGVDRFGPHEGVWVTDPVSSVPLAVALREQLIAIEGERSASIGKNDKIELIYRYIAGTEFRQRIQGIVDAFSGMQRQLASERAAMERQWSERQKQVEMVMRNTVGLYGDFRGIIGSGVPEIAALQLEGGEEAKGRLPTSVEALT